MNEERTSPYREKQRRLAKLREIYHEHKGESELALGTRFWQYLTLEGLGKITIDSYLEYMKAYIASQKREK